MYNSKVWSSVEDPGDVFNPGEVGLHNILGYGQKVNDEQKACDGI